VLGQEGETFRIVGRIEMERIGLAQDREQWKALVNTIMKLRVP
jgi:hypothetical protein